MEKKWFNPSFLAGITIAVVLFSGCAARPVSENSMPVPESGSQIISSVPSSSKPVLKGHAASTSSEAVPQGYPTPGSENLHEMAGSFACADFDPQYQPLLTLNTDGSFEFIVNLGEGMGSMKGTYSLDAYSLVLTITDKDFSGFAGDDLTSTTFAIIDNYTLLYTGAPIGLIAADSVFNKV